ncbi:MAG: HU family DNA-binding protein [Bacteroidaceae bacterium]|nr:HU family DNA-binding protein [Bacteroidaceae bacterium]
MYKIDWKQKDLINELNWRTGYYKKDIGVLLDAFEDAITDMMQEADEDGDVRIQLFSGVYVGSKFVPARAIKIPTGDIFDAPNIIKPYTQFTDSFKARVRYGNQSEVTLDFNEEGNEDDEE